MTKTSSLTLMAAALVAAIGFAVPAFAEDDSGTSFNDDQVRATLHERGIQVTGLNEVAGRIQATVQLADGSTEFQYFDINSLQPIARSGGNSRVLSDLDVGVDRAPVQSLQSLTWEDPPGND